MHLSYNGVTLELLTLDRVERRAVLTPDQTTILYYEWAISCSCVYAPSQVTSFGAELGGTSITFGSRGDADRDSSAQITAIGQDPAVVQFTMPGVEGPIYTDRELHYRLSVPRKPLVIWAYDVFDKPIVWLVSPRPLGGDQFLPCDATTGPIVQANVVTANIGGGNVFGVQLEIKTWVPPCPAGSDRAILGHRFQMAHTHDENNYLTRTTTGEIWFHGGLVDQFFLTPGGIARQLFHPIPLGFRRHLGPIVYSPDGLVVNYTFHDVDQKVVFDPAQSGATTMAISETVDYSVPMQGMWKGVAEMMQFFGGAIGAGMRSAGVSLGGGIVGGAAGVLMSGR